MESGTLFLNTFKVAIKWKRIVSKISSSSLYPYISLSLLLVTIEKALKNIIFDKRIFFVFVWIENFYTLVFSNFFYFR